MTPTGRCTSYSAVDDGQASPLYDPRFYVYWGTVNLGYVDSVSRAEGVIRQHLARRRRGQHDRAYRSEYRIVPAGGESS